MMKNLLLTSLLIISLDLAPAATAEQQPVAILNGNPIMSEQVESRAATKLYRLRWEIYDTLKTEAEALVDERLLEEEAKRRDLSIEKMIEQEVDAKAKKPTDADVEAYIKDQNIEDGSEEIRGRVVMYLTERERIQCKLDFLEKLRGQANYQFLLEPPVRPRQQVSVDDDPVRGAPDAPVTIIHFASFSCEHCAESARKIQRLTEEFPGAIRWVHRDFFNMFDEMGLLSAEAGELVHARGAFWEFHDQLYTHSGEYTKEDLYKLLAEMGVDPKKFDEAHKKATFLMEIKHDIEDGAAAGVSGVPAIFINGRYISGTFSYEKLKEMVEEELALPEAQKLPAPMKQRESGS